MSRITAAHANTHVRHIFLFSNATCTRGSQNATKLYFDARLVVNQMKMDVYKLWEFDPSPETWRRGWFSDDVVTEWEKFNTIPRIPTYRTAQFGDLWPTNGWHYFANSSLYPVGLPQKIKWFIRYSSTDGLQQYREVMCLQLITLRVVSVDKTIAVTKITNIYTKIQKHGFKTTENKF